MPCAVELWRLVYWFCVLDFPAVDWNSVFVRLVVQFSNFVTKLQESIFAVLRDGKVGPGV